MVEFSDYIHGLRLNSIKKIIPYIDRPEIQIGLEVGAGDGFQSRILVRYLSKLVVTDLDDKRLLFDDNNKIEYKICDAEAIGEIFEEEFFDFIYSSHLLEHLPKLDAFLTKSKKILHEEAVVIHTVPSTWYAIFRVLLWYLSILVRVRKKLRSKSKLNITSKNHEVRSNNLKKEMKPRMRILDILFPRPHGVSDTILQEFVALSLKSWISKFQNNGFIILTILKGDVYSGYGFGFEKIRKMLHTLGISSEYTFILKKTR